MIQIRNLKVVKQDKTICRVSELSIGQGERVGIIGPNGSGKTTLLRVLASLEPQYSGECRLDVNLGDRVYVHQVPYLLRGSVMFNVTYGLRCRGLRRPQRENLASEWLRRLHIEHLAERTGRDLSGGERRRVALARALVLRPRLLLLDEPLADLDASGVDDLQGALEHLPDTTVLVASPTEPRPAFHLRCVSLAD